MDPKSAGIRVDELLSAWSGLREFLEEFVRDLPPVLAQFIHAYVGGQLTALPRKSMGRLASVIGVSGGYLRKLLRDRRWDEEKLRSLVCSRVQRVHGKSLRGVIFEQTFEKSGYAIPGIEVQYSEERGRSLRSLSLTNLVLADREFCCISDSDPYLPPSWLTDGDRRAAAEIPWDHRYHPKWRCALGLVNRARQEGFRFDWLLLGRTYGAEIELLQSLSEVGQRFIAEAPETLQGWLYHPMVAPTHPEFQGTFPGAASPGQASRPSRSLKELTAGLAPGQEPPGDGASLGDEVSPWRAQILPFYAESHGLPTDPLGLLVLWNPRSRERRHFLSNGFLGVSLRSLTEIALSRDKIEGTCRDVADRVGLADVQVRNFTALRRHLILSTLSMLFRAERTAASPGDATLPKGGA